MSSLWRVYFKVLIEESGKWEIGKANLDVELEHQ